MIRWDCRPLTSIGVLVSVLNSKGNESRQGLTKDKRSNEEEGMGRKSITVSSKRSVVKVSITRTNWDSEIITGHRINNLSTIVETTERLLTPEGTEAIIKRMASYCPYSEVTTTVTTKRGVQHVTMSTTGIKNRSDGDRPLIVSFQRG